MRYSVLAHLSKMARTLQEAALYIDTAPDGDPVCPELLSNGVKMLEQIRGTVEQHREDLHDPVLLEHLSAAEALWEEGGDALQGALEAFAQALPDSIRYQVRAVFFTGLGSTWDAMESVYEYMRDDPRFDPVVVHIPVFRRVEQDGQIRQEVTYIDYLSPMNIPFFDYDQYSLKNDCPDLAFTNQPYESVVPEEFWPGNIAQYTRLVYLPYFAPFSVYESAREALCEMPVYRCAWKVIGSSERHHKYYRKHAANGGGNMLVTGVPKWDPTVRLRTEPVEAPKSWEPIISGRRVFLWNSFYDFSGSSIPYFVSIYQWFQAHPDCALIWRAHPMTDTVTKLYYPPEYYERLEKCIELVEEAPNMLCDREASYKAAFCNTEAMISDLSSMMFQYLLLDKPVLYIETNGRGKVDKEFFIDACWMARAENADAIKSFLDDIYCGKDENRQLRGMVRQRDIPMADGHSGERVCNELWDCLHREDKI